MKKNPPLVFFQKMKGLREEIDAADEIIIKAFRARFRAVSAVGKLKRKYGLPLYQRARWAEVVADRLKRSTRARIDENFMKSLLKIIHQESIRIQRGKNEK